ncbi:MAG: hypothetical protein HYZ18_14815 [Pseudogulbenkiania sp.]|nr:hypothetical protein [Pseudogulbenkiania sp.]
MNPRHDALQLCTEPAMPSLPGCAITLLRDVELLSAGTTRVAELRATRAMPGTLLLAESRLPGIRTVAMLLAAARNRSDGGRAPARFSDAADWLAARILLLGLSHVAVTADTLPQLDEANRRAAELSQRLGLEPSAAAPVLMTGKTGEDEGGLCQPLWLERCPVERVIEFCRAQTAQLLARWDAVGI